MYIGRITRCKWKRDNDSSGLSYVLIYDECPINDLWALYTVGEASNSVDNLRGELKVHNIKHDSV